MKRILSISLAAAMLLCMLVGCGSSPSSAAPSSPSPGSAAPTEEKTLSLWYWQSDMEQAWNDNLIADFEAANPGVKIDMTIMPWSEYWQKVQTATVSNTLPDLMVMSVAYIEQYAKAGVVVDLKDYIDRDLDRSEYYEFAMNTTRLSDGHRCV